jgi:hypothetical protein
MADRPIRIYKGYIRKDGEGIPAPSIPNPDDIRDPQEQPGTNPPHNALGGLQGGDPETSEFFHLTAAEKAAIQADTSTRRISGGIIQWTGTGFIFSVSPIIYKVQGTDLQIVNAANITLGASHPTLNRTDAIYVDADQTFKVKVGANGPTFVLPDINPITEVLVGFIQIPAAATTPAGLSDVIVYDEGTETTFSYSGPGTGVDDDTADPYVGTYACKITSPGQNSIAAFSFGSDQNFNSATSLGFFLQLLGPIRNQDSIRARWKNASNIQVGTELAFSFNKGNVDPSVVGNYQFAGIDFALFGIGATPVRKLEIIYKRNAGQALGFRMDLIKVENGLIQPTPEPTPGIPEAPSDAKVYGRKDADWIDAKPVNLPAYANQAAMLADQANQIAGFLYQDNASTWAKLATSTGLIADYIKVGDIADGGGGTPTAAVIGRYDIDTSGTTAPVGSKDIRYNNATQISATELFISDLTEDNIDVDLFLSLIKEGSALVIQDRDDHLNYQIYEVSGTPSFVSATWTFPVTFKDSGGTGTTNFANNHKSLLSTLSAGGINGGGGHVIKTNGTPLTQRAGLNFSTEFTVTDDAGNDETDVQMNTNIMATKAYVDGGANSTNAASRLYLFNNY